MTVYVAKCAPYHFLWGDTPEEALCMIYAIGSDESSKMDNKNWDHYLIGRLETELAVELGAVLTDRLGPAEWMAKRRNSPENRDFLSRIAQVRAVGRV